MAPTTPVGDAPTLNPAAAEALIDAFARSVEKHTYRVADLPGEGAIQTILGLGDPDTRLIIVRMAEHIGRVRVMQAQARSPGGCAGLTEGMNHSASSLSLLLAKLLLRSHDFTASDMVALVRSAYSPTDSYCFCMYRPGLGKAIERFAAAGPLPAELAVLVAGFVHLLQANRDSESTRLAARLDRILNPSGSESSSGRPIGRWERFLLDRADFEPRTPALVDAFLAAMVVPAEDNAAGAVSFGVIAFAPHPAPALINALNASLAAAPSAYRGRELSSVQPALTTAGAPGINVMLAAAAAMGARPIRYDFDAPRAQRFHNGCEGLVRESARALAGCGAADLDTLADIATSLSRFRPPEYIYAPWSEIALSFRRLASPQAERLTDEHVFALVRFREWIARSGNPGDRAGVRAIDELLGVRTDLPFELGEPWADRAFEDLMACSDAERSAWIVLLEVAAQAKGAAPSAKWLKAADGAIAALPRGTVESSLASWIALVGKPRPTLAGGKVPGRDSSIPSDSAADLLRGLALVASRFDTPMMARALGDLAMACFKMVPGHGARCQKPGSSAMWALAHMTTPGALAQLSRLRQLVKFGTAKKMLETSLENLAAKFGVTTEELHEMAAPDFGLSAEATLAEEAGDFTIELLAEPHGARVRVVDDMGKERKTVPEVVKKEHGDTLKAFKQTRDDIDKMLEAQRARIDALFIADRVWPVRDWRERYIDHPLVGVLGRRLIWRIVDDQRSESPGTPVFRRPGSQAFADIDGTPVEPRDGQHVRLWHPMFAGADEVRRWRELVESSGVRQPVRQAHREVYPLTPAEQATGTYSNRFAAHIIKQHAFQQLVAERGWTSKLRLMVDAEYPPPSRTLPSWAIRAEFWVESIGDNFGADTTASGSFLYLATDQVRFYRIGAATAHAHASGGGYSTHGPDTPDNQPLSLDQVPPLVFSEIMRDVDLFVGGASVGNNADWQDGGPGGRFRDYWQRFSFGELAASGKARLEFLQRLVPRLKIGHLCSFEGTFLVVKGTLRTYKIHLGSGNILMAPNDQYLCIVPNSSFSADNGPGGVFLPFDGDRTLSIILSKAFLLADDAKIKDHSIVAQIRRA